MKKHLIHFMFSKHKQKVPDSSKEDFTFKELQLINGVAKYSFITLVCSEVSRFWPMKR